MAESHHAGRFPYVPAPEKMRKPIPNLATVYRVERIMIDANKRGDDPITLEEIKRRLGSKGIRHVTVRTCVDELVRQGKVTITSDGVLWTWLSPAGVTLLKKLGYKG
ncbi:MAG: hypothetical protein WDA16_03040 [Candidatus Thermoplasmatota archaeon]